MTEQPAWARGFDMEFLKECAGIFRASMKQHTYGAFGLPKERDIADALADNALAWTAGAGAIAKQLSRPSKHEDFAGRKATILAGDVYVKAIAGEPAAMKRILEGLRRKAPAAAMWVEAHVESKEIVSLLREMGFERVMTKIAASSDLKGLFLHGSEERRLPSPLEDADKPSSAILAEEFISEKEQLAILAEAERAHKWAQHYSSYNKRQSWTAFAIRGFDPSDPGFIIKPAEMSKKWKEENAERLEAACGSTVVFKDFPTAQKVMRRIPGNFERARLMRLSKEGGELSRHADITDPDAGTGDKQLSRLHIPLQSSPSCEFHTWDLEGRESRLHFPERALCYLDTRKPHAVTNPGGLDRIHLVLDTFGSPELREMIAGKRKGRSKRAA